MIRIEDLEHRVPEVPEAEGLGKRSELPGPSAWERLQGEWERIKDEGRNGQELGGMEDDVSKEPGDMIPETPEEGREAPAPSARERLNDEGEKKKEAGQNGAETDGERKPNPIVEIDGESYRTDDNGVPYARQNPETKEFELLPNSKYTLNGYVYYTDGLGRQIKVEGRLHLKEEDGRKPINEDVPDKTPGDERGHLIGDRFDGSNLRGNLVAMSFDLNRSEYKALENKLGKALESGSEVTVKIEPKYEGDSKRPTKIIVTYTIDGKVYKETFLNGTGGNNG